MAVPVQDAIAALFTETSAPVATLAATALTSIPAFLVWYFNRLDKRNVQTLTREEQLNKRQAEMDEDRSRAFAELRAENTWLQGELDKQRRDVLRGWDLARFWHGAAHDLLRQFSNLRHNALNMQQWIQTVLKRHPAVEAPVALEPVPGRIDLPMGLEDPINPRQGVKT